MQPLDRRCRRGSPRSAGRTGRARGRVARSVALPLAARRGGGLDRLPSPRARGRALGGRLRGRGRGGRRRRRRIHEWLGCSGTFGYRWGGTRRSRSPRVHVSKECDPGPRVDLAGHGQPGASLELDDGVFCAGTVDAVDDEAEGALHLAHGRADAAEFEEHLICVAMRVGLGGRARGRRLRARERDAGGDRSDRDRGCRGDGGAAPPPNLAASRLRELATPERALKRALPKVRGPEITDDRRHCFFPFVRAYEVS
jgi:hypothetical protein